MYQAKTHSIAVTVTPTFLAEQSLPEDDHYVWIYDIIIENQSSHSVQLINRYWNICDAKGHIEEVHGTGVVGEQPLIRPGESFRYQSGCPLSTPSGIMRGHFEMRNDDGLLFCAQVPNFSLDSPYQARSLN